MRTLHCRLSLTVILRLDDQYVVVFLECFSLLIKVDSIKTSPLVVISGKTICGEDVALLT